MIITNIMHIHTQQVTLSFFTNTYIKNIDTLLINIAYKVLNKIEEPITGVWFGE